MSVSGTGAISSPWQVFLAAELQQLRLERGSLSDLGLDGEMCLTVSPTCFLGLAIPSAGLSSFLRRCFGRSELIAGQEFRPAVHYLRFSALT